jgi:hypothetical protein
MVKNTKGEWVQRDWRYILQVEMKLFGKEIPASLEQRLALTNELCRTTGGLMSKEVIASIVEAWVREVGSHISVEA